MGKHDVFYVSPSESHLVSAGTGKTRSLPVLMVKQRSMNAGLLNVNTGKLRICGDPRHYMRAECGGHGAYHACPWHPMLGAMGKHDGFYVSPSESHLVSAGTGKTRSLPVLMVEQRSMNAGLLNVNTGKLRMCGDPRHYTRAESGGHGAYHACPWHPMLGAMQRRPPSRRFMIVSTR